VQELVTPLCFRLLILASVLALIFGDWSAFWRLQTGRATCVLLARWRLGRAEAVNVHEAVRNRAKTAAKINGQKATTRYKLAPYTLV
jgi:hypothetical protein